MFRELDISKISDEIHLLSLRIQDRFPSASLLNVCRELNKLANKGRNTLYEYSKPYLYYRILSYLFFIVAFLSVVAAVANFIHALFFNFSNHNIRLSQSESIQSVEALLNIIVMVVAGVFFLFKIEGRSKQKKILKSLQELRTIIHIIDMHQLTKDPEILLQEKTTHSPSRTLTKKELNRYLNYCIEMLSLTSKVAAAHGKNINDQLVLEEIHNIETLASLLSNKIWQKININNLNV